jgi:hypothetical protein
VADFGVKLNTRALKAIQERLLGAPLRKRLTAALEGVAEGVRTDARREWPEDRSPRTGLVLSGPAYVSVARKKGHSVAEHSADLFGIRIDQRPFGVAVVLFNRAEWAYKIRSRQIGLAPGQRIAWARRKRGESIDDYYARIGSGARPKHAWSVLVRDPGRRANKALAQRMADTAAEVANGG